MAANTEKKKVIKRKVISKVKNKEVLPQSENLPVDEDVAKETKSKKRCLFCQNKSNPSYTDLSVLRRFLSDRAKILPKARSNICAKHQRAVAKNIKHARHLALLPFVPKV